jgi:hypothetical protein
MLSTRKYLFPFLHNPLFAFPQSSLLRNHLDTTDRKTIALAPLRHWEAGKAGVAHRVGEDHMASGRTRKSIMNAHSSQPS